jgi:hypothetical protein
MTQDLQHPRLRLDFYQTAVLLSRREEDGRIRTHPVSVHDVVSACANLTLGSGLLPANTLFWQQADSQVAMGLYVPARRWRMRTEERVYQLHMPPFVFVGKGSGYRIFAVKERPAGEEEPLYHTPCPNVHHHGGICVGDTPFPDCAPQTIETALTLFMEDSLFNSDLSRGRCRRYPDDVRQLWAELEGKNRFPLSELVSCGRVMRDLQ